MISERMNRALRNLYVTFDNHPVQVMQGGFPGSCDPSLTSLSLSLSGSGFNARPGIVISSSMPVYITSSH